MKKINRDAFQGTLNENNYFEGWYYKQVTKDNKCTFSIIPGISIQTDNPHCFIQIIENKTNTSYYIQYDVKDFSYLKDTFEIRIGNNFFTEEQIHLDIDRKELKLYGDLYFTDSIKLNKTIYRPTIMGPFTYLKSMECNHGIVSLYHSTTGSIHYNRKKINFNDGTGYIEKDYGTSFPKKYLWIQSQNSLYHDKSTFMLSIANIPLKLLSFEGIIGVISTKKKQYVFASYYGAKIIRRIETEDKIIILLKQKNLYLKVTCNYQDGHQLLAPKEGKMATHLKESLEGEVVVELFNKSKRIFYDKYIQAGVERVPHFK